MTKKQDVMSSFSFKKWWSRRRLEDPVPANPYRAFMIDKSLRARANENKWKSQPNRFDIYVDRPTVFKQTKRKAVGARKRVSKAPKAPKGSITRKEIVEMTREYTRKHHLPMPKITVKASRGRSRHTSFMRVHWRRIDTGEAIPHKAEMTIVKGKGSKAALKGVIYHELGHMRDAYKGKTYHTFVSKPRLQRERQATKYARQEMKETKMKGRAVASWRLRYAFGTYQAADEPHKVPGFVSALSKARKEAYERKLASL